YQELSQVSQSPLLGTFWLYSLTSVQELSQVSQKSPLGYFLTLFPHQCIRN
ncbi:hypothetical protein OS493_026994, partial [Desmophyllum pertusum]